MKTLKPTFAIIALMAIILNAQSQVILVAEKTDSTLISNLIVAGDNLFFSTYTFRDSIGIWATDGSLGSTQMLKKLPTTFGNLEANPLFFYDLNGQLIFQALESYTVDEFGYPTFGSYLWKSDGTIDGTVKLKELETWFYLSDAAPSTWGGKYIQLGDKLFFAASDPDTMNFELWLTDGTSNGTNEFLEINNNYIQSPYFLDNKSSFPSSLTKIDDKMYFSANDGIHGQELWVTDGSAAGTHMVKDITKGDTVSLDYYYHEETFKASNNNLFFTAYYGKQLWVSDGTETGTKPIKKYDFPVSSASNGIFVDELTDVNNELYFLVCYWNYNKLGADSLKLWKTDGTENGTAEVYNISDMEVSSLINFKSELYFLSKNSAMYELWKSDGTKNGTMKISEFQMPEFQTSKLYAFNDSIYFAAFDANYVLKIWKSDGTSSGTQPVENWDVTDLTSISELVLYNDGIYFVGNYPNYGAAVFKYLNDPHVYTLDVSDASENNLSINPNPTCNYLNIDLPNSHDGGIITIYSITGSKTLSFKVQAGKQMINTDVSSLKNGIYFVSFSGKSNSRIAKFVKQ